MGPEQDDFLIRIARISFYGGLFAVSLMTLRVGGGITAGDIMLVCSLSLTLLAVHRPRTPHPFGRWAIPSSLIVVVGGLVATLASPQPLDSLTNLLRVVFVALILPWQAAVLLHSPGKVNRALMAYGLGAATCSLGTAVQFAFGPTSIPGGEITNAGRYTGFTGHVSDTGAIASLALVVGVVGLGQEVTRTKRLILLVVSLCGVFGLWLSGSVSGLLAAAIGVLALLVTRGVGVWRAVLAASVIAMGLYYAPGLITQTDGALTPGERIMQVLGLSGGDTTLNTSASRWDTVVAGWEGFLEHPISGRGLDTESSIVLSTLPVHSFPVAALYQGGIIFAAGLMVCVAMSAVLIFRRRRASVLSGRLFGVVVAAVAFAATAPSFYNRYLWVPLAIGAAGVVMASEAQETAEVPVQVTPSVRRPLRVQNATWPDVDQS